VYFVDDQLVVVQRRGTNYFWASCVSLWLQINYSMPLRWGPSW